MAAAIGPGDHIPYQVVTPALDAAIGVGKDGTQVAACVVVVTSDIAIRVGECGEAVERAPVREAGHAPVWIRPSNAVASAFVGIGVRSSRRVRGARELELVIVFQE